MPLSGFDPEQCELTPRLKALAPAFLCSIQKYTADAPVKSPVIERGLHITGADVRAVVNHLRNEGHPIGSNGRGYFLARNKAELESTIEHLEQRGNVCLRTARQLRSAFNFQIGISA